MWHNLPQSDNLDFVSVETEEGLPFSLENQSNNTKTGKTADISQRQLLVSLRNDVWEMSAEMPYWWRVTTHIWVGSASDWLKQTYRQSKVLPTQIWVVTCHQYEISAFVSHTSFHRETSGGVAKCRLFSQAKYKHLKMTNINKYESEGTSL